MLINYCTLDEALEVNNVTIANIAEEISESGSLTIEDENDIIIDTSLWFDENRTDFEITILLKLVSTSFESIIAELLYKLYSDKTYIINVGFGGLIIW